MQAVRDDYAPLIEFARITGLRSAEVRTLEWSHVNWGTRQIVRLGKGGRRVSTPITDEVREVLWPLQGHHDRYVFTYTCRRTKLPDLIKGAALSCHQGRSQDGLAAATGEGRNSRAGWV
jgi:integrase